MQLSPAEIDPPCTVSQVAAALQPLISQPSSSAAPFTTSRLHLPTTTPSAASRRCARAAFDAFACSLPRYSGAHIPVSDWLFGAVPATMGKFVGYWSLALYLTSSSAGSAQRPDWSAAK